LKKILDTAMDSFAHGFCENLCKDHSRSFAVTRDFAKGKKNYLEQAGPSFPLHSLVAPSAVAAHLFGEAFSLIFKTFVNYCKLVIPGVKCTHAIRELWVSMPALLVPSENSSEIHFTIKSPIETGKRGNWAGQWGGGGLYIPVNNELRMINTCPKKQEWNINKAPPQQSFYLYSQDKFKTN